MFKLSRYFWITRVRDIKSVNLVCLSTKRTGPEFCLRIRNTVFDTVIELDEGYDTCENVFPKFAGPSTNATENKNEPREGRDE